MALPPVMKTALWAAALRVQTADQVGALVSDPFAMTLIGEEGFERGLAYEGEHNAGKDILRRTRVFDDWIQQIIREQGIDTVIYPGCGLDTRAYRLSLPATLNWIEIDFPNVLNWKEAALTGVTPSCRLKRIPADLSAPHAVKTAMGDLANAGTCLVVMENLLHYLEGLQAQNLFQDICGFGTKNFVLADIGSPELPHSALGKAMFGEMEKATNLRVGIADIESFVTHTGYRILRSVSLMALRGAPETWLTATPPWWVTKTKRDLLRIVLLERLH